MAAPPPPRAAAPPACSTSAPAERCPDVNGTRAPPRDPPVPHRDLSAPPRDRPGAARTLRTAPGPVRTAICPHRNLPAPPGPVVGLRLPHPRAALPAGAAAQACRSPRGAKGPAGGPAWENSAGAASEAEGAEGGNAASQKGAPRDGLGAGSGLGSPPPQGETWHGATGKVWPSKVRVQYQVVVSEACRGGFSIGIPHNQTSLIRLFLVTQCRGLCAVATVTPLPQHPATGPAAPSLMARSVMPAVLPGKVGMLGKRSRTDSILPADVEMLWH